MPSSCAASPPVWRDLLSWETGNELPPVATARHHIAHGGSATTPAGATDRLVDEIEALLAPADDSADQLALTLV